MIQLSQAAVHEILRLRSRHPSRSSKLRISVSSSGCHSFSYKLAFDDSSQLNDLIYSSQYDESLEVVVDTVNLQYLDGLVVDYSEDMMGGGFRFYNPKAVHVCGCGNSFSVQDD
ncbi:MAG: iron-sulfur cluster assembly accessory protein [Oscillatoriales cyanobacterium C42_A2020_001]|nr:iron-sulfur cluster assembly accessory protein [Leptolyngbyaceae cyanobacterium C42_A2020_001]